MSAWAYNWATVGVLWRRDLRRFLRQPSRLLGALGQPVIFWTVIGHGLNASFKVPGSELGYLEYFYPGVVLMVALFASIFASVSVIDDRHHGFLQAVLAGPAATWALVAGKCLGSASVALLQIGAFLALAPLAGFGLTAIDWPLLAGALVAITVGLSALGFAVAWWLDNVQAYHAIQMTFLVPLWVVSGAMFPRAGAPSAFAYAMAVNPFAYALSAVRHALYHAPPPGALALTASPWLALAGVAAFATVSLGLATALARR